MSELFSGGASASVPAAEAVSPGGMSPTEFSAIPGASGGQAPSDSSGWSWPSSLNAQNTANALKIVAQLQQMAGQNKTGVPTTPSGPQLLRGTPAAAMQPVTAPAVTRGTSVGGGGGGVNILQLLQLLMRGRQ